jgi:hypothetical protein
MIPIAECSTIHVHLVLYITEQDQLLQYFSQVSLIRKQVRNAETDTYAGLGERRQAQAHAPDGTVTSQN